MDVGGVHVLSGGVPHQGFADFLQYAGFHHSAVEGVPKIVEPKFCQARLCDPKSPLLGDVDRWHHGAIRVANHEIFIGYPLAQL